MWRPTASSTRRASGHQADGASLATPTNLGDVLMATAFSLRCGFDHLLPDGYVIFLTILLVHRTYRDDRRCRAKYGAARSAYCARVPDRMVPRLW